MKKIALLITGFIILSATPVMAHCQIPCGVYDDEARLESVLEHTQTIEKAMNKINELSAADDEDYHTIIRWTMNKEEHAQKIQEIASEYFLTQRVKAPKENAETHEQAAYALHLSLLHQLMVTAMKAKQTTDTAYTDALRSLTEKYKTHYFSEAGHQH